jgi:hypothetical protein
MTGGILCALVAGLILLSRNKKPEPKWLLLIGLLEVCAENPSGGDEADYLQPQGRNNS